MYKNPPAAHFSTKPEAINRIIPNNGHWYITGSADHSVTVNALIMTPASTCRALPSSDNVRRHSLALGRA